MLISIFDILIFFCHPRRENSFQREPCSEPGLDDSEYGLVLVPRRRTLKWLWWAPRSVRAQSQLYGTRATTDNIAKNHFRKREFLEIESVPRGSQTKVKLGTKIRV